VSNFDYQNFFCGSSSSGRRRGRGRGFFAC